MATHQTKIDKLINELCPKGVEYKELGEVLDYEQPTKYIVNSVKYDDDFKIPVLTAGQSFILGYTDEIEGVYEANKEKPVIIFDDFTTSFHWVDFDFKVKSSAMKMLEPQKNHEVNFKFVYYAMKCITYKPTDHARHWISQYSKIKIPLPPLPIQEEIVKILDSFTELETELEAELEARKKQYEHYRENLLSFGDEFEYVPLKELCKIGDGLHGTPKYDPSGKYYFINGNNLKKGKVICEEHTKKVNEDMYNKYGIKFIVDKTLFMSINGTIGSLAFFNREDVVLGKSVAYFNINSEHLNPRFLYYFLQTNFSKDYYESQKTGATIKNLGLKALREFKIPLPPLPKQERIVAILDKFDSLVNDISIGLPAELDARRNQYEYFREKLLTFKEKIKDE